MLIHLKYLFNRLTPLAFVFILYSCGVGNTSAAVSEPIVLSQGLQDLELQVGKVIVFTSRLDTTVMITAALTNEGQQYYLQFIEGNQASTPIIPNNLQTEYRDRIWYSATLEGVNTRYWLQYDSSIWNAEVK